MSHPLLLTLALFFVLAVLATAQLVPVLDFTNPPVNLTDLDPADMTTSDTNYPFEVSNPTTTPFIVFQGTDDYSNPSTPQSLLDVLPRDKSLSTFLDVLMRDSDIVKIISNPALDPPLTLFSPTNAAMKHFLNEEGGRAILRNEQKLKEFLQYHIAPAGKMSIKQLKERSDFDTMLAGKKVTVKFHLLRRVLVLNGYCNVNQTEKVEAANGIAHKIDAVLKPRE
ncbi:FAS1 domain-containing protein [Jimgerdemannia flammicorona]|uniref:FAS1 domain-containing protein n=1 Tax=Jimgerdemannia flammicorona TaxID=994334 RepID=A0A433D5S6_9FUNG|nr:FAS1 domain-containing protein [Jimgerdemannia flammicorona]